MFSMVCSLVLAWSSSGSRRVHVQHVLTSMMVYLAMAVDIPKWGLDAIDKIRMVLFGGAGRRQEEAIVL